MGSLRSSLSRDWGGGEALPSQRSFRPLDGGEEVGEGHAYESGSQIWQMKVQHARFNVNFR